MNADANITKRKLLSEICKLFDPLGWIGPAIVKAKFLNQMLWKRKIDWDEPVPSDIQVWSQIVNEAKCVEDIRIPRWLKVTREAKLSIHAFCDAPEMAYAAAVYLRAENKDGTIDCNLMTAKTKVSPVETISLPRLELCGAVLLSKLVNKIVHACEMHRVVTSCCVGVD